MDELQTIREKAKIIQGYVENGEPLPIEGSPYYSASVALEDLFAALSRLEALAAEMPDMAKIVERINESVHFDKTFPGLECWKVKDDLVSSLISQYAYRYSEDIRKERDEWKQLSMDLAVIAAEKIGIKLTYK